MSNICIIYDAFSQISAFFAESLPSVGGQIILPRGYSPKVAK